MHGFKHDSELDNVPAPALFDRVTVKLKEDGSVVRSFDTYSVSFNGQTLAVREPVQSALGVTLSRRT